jgi:hypothetical protein
MSTPFASSDPAWSTSFTAQPGAAEARSAWTQARARLEGEQNRLAKRLTLAQTAIAVALFFVWFVNHSFLVAMVYTGVTWLVLSPLPLLARRMTRRAGEEVAQAERQVVETDALEAERFMSAAGLGHFEWIAEEDVVLGVFPERGHLYYYGPHTDYQHLLLRADAVRQVTIADNTSSVQESLREIAEHDPHGAVIDTPHVMIERRRSFPVATVLPAGKPHHYVLEIEMRAPGEAESTWYDIPFMNERKQAEDWRRMILQAKAAAEA